MSAARPNQCGIGAHTSENHEYRVLVETARGWTPLGYTEFLDKALDLAASNEANGRPAFVQECIWRAVARGE